MLSFKQKLSKFRGFIEHHIAFSALVLVFTLSIFVGSENLFVQAANPTLNLSPGQTVSITIFYDNASTTTDYSGTGRIGILIDEKLEYIPGFLKDVYETDTRCVNDGVSGGVRSIQTVAGQQTTIIDYTPRSSGVLGSSGQCETGGGLKGNTANIFLPRAGASFNPANQSTWRGRLQFRVKLKDNITSAPYNLKIGDIIQSNIEAGSVGIQGEFSLSNVVYGSPKFDIKISGVILSQANIGNINCLNNPVVAGENITCNFSLSGGNASTNPYILPEDFRLQVDGATQFASKNNCTLRAAENILTCIIPTTAAPAGDDKSVRLTSSGTTQIRFNIDIISDFLADGDFDKDGISYEAECGNSVGANCTDTNANGTPDWKDTDSDGDGIPDFAERECTFDVGTGNPCDSDGDGTPDFRDLDSDNDEKLDIEEKGTLSCNPNLPPQCTGELSDADGDGIPDFRDKDDTSVNNLRYLVEFNNIKFSTASQFDTVWQETDLTLSASISRQVRDCTIRFRKYSSDFWWTDAEIRLEGQNCVGVLKADRQYTQKWDVQVIITDAEGERWGAYPSYQFDNGPVGQTLITLSEQAMVEV
jgi:hypothetical protein